MQRVDLPTVVMAGWSRLTATERDPFFRMFLRASLRLEPAALRAWLLKRLKTRPLAAPIDLTRFAVPDFDFALLMKATREDPGESAAQRDEAAGG
jgi:hypothetical protein